VTLRGDKVLQTLGSSRHLEQPAAAVHGSREAALQRSNFICRNKRQTNRASRIRCFAAALFVYNFSDGKAATCSFAFIFRTHHAEEA